MRAVAGIHKSIGVLKLSHRASANCSWMLGSLSVTLAGLPACKYFLHDITNTEPLCCTIVLEDALLLERCIILPHSCHCPNWKGLHTLTGITSLSG